jgi:hypothetical protein
MFSVPPKFQHTARGESQPLCVELLRATEGTESSNRKLPTVILSAAKGPGIYRIDQLPESFLDVRAHSSPVIPARSPCARHPSSGVVVVFQVQHR